MAGAVFNVADQRRVRVQVFDDQTGELRVLVLLVRGDVVHLAGPPFLQHELDRGAVIVDMEPVAHLPPVAVEGQCVSVQRVRREQGQDLLRVLVRPVGVGTARDRCVDAEGTHAREHLEVAAGLRGAVRTRRAQWIVFARRPARFDVPVHLVGRDMHEACAQLARGLQEDERPEHVRADEVLRPQDRPVDVRLGREIDDRFDSAQLVDVLAHGDVAAVALDTGRQIGRVPGVRELVEHDDVLAGGEHPFDEMRADEARPAGDQEAHGVTV